MKRFQFRLESLLRLREAARDECRAQLADVQRTKAALDKQMARLLGEITDARQAHPATVGNIDVERLLEAQRYAMILDGERRNLEQQQATITAHVETRRQALVKADQAVRVLETLRDKQAARWRADADKQSMNELDEAASRQAARERVR